MQELVRDFIDDVMSAESLLLETAPENSGLSSNMDDYFEPEVAMFVALK